MDFSLSRTFSILVKTTPFIVIRLLAYFAITLAYIVGTGGGAGLGYLIGKIGDNPESFAFWGAFGGFGIISGVLYFLREYILYIVKAGHIAVIVRLLDEEPVPRGKGQIEFAREEVKKRFAQASALFVLDQAIKGVVKVLNGLLFSIGALVPLPGLQGIVGFVNQVIKLSLSYVDEVMLAYNIRTQSENPWTASRDALVLYAQNFGAMVKNAAVLSLLAWMITLLIFLVVLSPAAALVGFFPSVAGFWSMVLALVFALALKAAVVDPFVMVSLLQAYFRIIGEQQPDPKWVEKLDSASDKFRELGEKARGFAS